jgi:putative nucleotidyltransferase with HDIG domain
VPRHRHPRAVIAGDTPARAAQTPDVPQTQHVQTQDVLRTQNHSYRVSVYAAKIAEAMGPGSERIEDVRAAALLHDIGKLEIAPEKDYAGVDKKSFQPLFASIQFK